MTEENKRIIKEPIHPGSFIRKELMLPFNIELKELSDRLGYSFGELRRIIEERPGHGIDINLAFRLAKLFGWSPFTWLDLQRAYELNLFMRDSAQAMANIERIKQVEYDEEKRCLVEKPATME